MSSKFSGGTLRDGSAQNIAERITSPKQQTSTSPSKSELPPVVSGSKKNPTDNSRQHLYPSYKRLNSKISLPPIDPPLATLTLDTESDESFSLLRTKLLNPEAQKKMTPQKKPKRVALKKSRSTQSLPSSEKQAILTSSSEKQLSSSSALAKTSSPQKADSIPKDKVASRRGSLEGASVRRLSMAQRLSLAKVETPTSRMDQWTVLSSTTNSALRIVVDS